MNPDTLRDFEDGEPWIDPDDATRWLIAGNPDA